MLKEHRSCAVHTVRMSGLSSRHYTILLSRASFFVDRAAAAAIVAAVERRETTIRFESLDGDSGDRVPREIGLHEIVTLIGHDGIKNSALERALRPAVVSLSDYTARRSLAASR